MKRYLPNQYLFEVIECLAKLWNVETTIIFKDTANENIIDQHYIFMIYRPQQNLSSVTRQIHIFHFKSLLVTYCKDEQWQTNLQSKMKEINFVHMIDKNLLCVKTMDC